MVQGLLDVCWLLCRSNVLASCKPSQRPGFMARRKPQTTINVSLLYSCGSLALRCIRCAYPSHDARQVFVARDKGDRKLALTSPRRLAEGMRGTTPQP